MKITVVFLGRASEIANKTIIEVELPSNSTLIDLMKKLSELTNSAIYRRFIEGHFVFITLINDKPVIDPNTVLRDGDRVVFITPEMGG